MGNEFKRMRYFDGLFLDAEDYRLDQKYQQRLHQLHSRYLHTWGIITGLEVELVEKPQAGLETEQVYGTLRKIKVSEGLALNQVEVNGESISQEIYIYPEHPDCILDLSKYLANETIYITVSYSEVEEQLINKANIKNQQFEDYVEKGNGQGIHILEKCSIKHSSQKPVDPKQEIILARIVPKPEGDAIVIKPDCIFTELRTYAGPAGKALALEKIIFNLKEDTRKPYIRALDMGNKKVGLEVDSPLTSFTGKVNIKGDLIVEGNLTVDTGNPQSEVTIANSFIQVNTPSKGDKPTDQFGGLEVYRGLQEHDARVAWYESDKRWKIGTLDKMYDIAYGPLWERLIKGGNTDDLHKHSRITSSSGTVLTVDENNNLFLNTNLTLKDKTVWLRSLGDTSHGLGWFGVGKPFAGINVDGPVLFGKNGGILGTTAGVQKSVLSWNSTGNVGIGVEAPKADNLEVHESLKILSGTNPVRFTSAWSGFPNNGVNQAEISNDTTNYKTLMIVGNRSADEGTRRVGIWDRLDVNGQLFVNGSMQLSQALTPSAGNGANNGIIFPKDPGGGSSDSAWIKYYPRSGEACTLEIRTSNDGDDNISLMASGNVGIGTATPADKLDVSGWVRFLSDSNPLRITSSWNPSNDPGTANYAEICNDTAKYKSLLIIGNRSDGHERKVSVWDKLEVNGVLQVKGNFQSTNAIVPSVGNSENNGIMFPKDHGGGWGDAAWIRYYQDTRRGAGENMTLEIGVSNDGYYNSIGGDRLCLHASGGVYIDGYFYYSSSREYKENISGLPTQKAKEILEGLNPVSFNFKGDTAKTTMGFIAEEVPESVAAHDQKAVSPMEIIAVLTSVVKDQKKAIKKLQKQLDEIAG